MANRTEAMKQKPDDRPLTPSMRFMALIIPTAAKTVSGTATHAGMPFMPNTPHRLLIEASFTYISHSTTRISITNLIVGVRPNTSSMVPRYSIMSMAAISMKTLGVLNIACELHTPIIMPKNTANPPNTGIGLR